VIASLPQSARFYVHPVEIHQSLIGFVTQSGDGYRFFALNNAFASLEDSCFGAADDACNAALALERRTESRTRKKGQARKARPEDVNPRSFLQRRERNHV
jgi:hypothetical protein